MPLYRFGPAGLETVASTSLVAEQIRERRDLQRVLRQRIDVVGDDLLVVAEEYGSFEGSGRRIDLLALDRAGVLVVIELKRDDGGHMELQALRYAAMVSTMTADHVVEEFAETHEVEVAEARDRLTEWVGQPFEDLPNQVRIILVSAAFSTEMTSTVIWLNDNYNTDISCYRFVPYRFGEEILLDIQQIIPLPEARDFQIQQRQKGAATTAVRSGQSARDRTPYELVIGGKVFPSRSRQVAVKTAIQQLYSAGVSLELIKSVTHAKRWMPTHPQPGEAVRDAFQREHSNRATKGRWFDLNISDGEINWVIPRFGGEETEKLLEGLVGIAGPHTTMRWSRAEELDDAGSIPEPET